MLKVSVNLEDTAFARAFARGLSAEGRNLCFALTGDCSDETAFDLILTDREPKAHHHVQLVGHPDEAGIYDGPPYRIFRFEDARQVVSNLLYIYYRETGRNLEFAGDTRCKVLAFTSLSGGQPVTALALLTGELLDKHFGARCLYLNLCPIDGSKCFLPSGSSKGLLTLLYYLHQDKDFPLTSFIRQNLHVDHIDTNIYNPYFDELDSLQLHRLLKKVDDLGKYTYLIIDLGNHLSRRNQSLLAHAEEIVFVTGYLDRFPENFAEEAACIIEKHAAGKKVRRISLDRQQTDAETSLADLEETGLLDLSAMKDLQWEAGRLVHEMMEYREHD